MPNTHLYHQLLSLLWSRLLINLFLIQPPGVSNSLPFPASPDTCPAFCVVLCSTRVLSCYFPFLHFQTVFVHQFHKLTCPVRYLTACFDNCLTLDFISVKLCLVSVRTVSIYLPAFSSYLCWAIINSSNFSYYKTTCWTKDELVVLRRAWYIPILIWLTFT